MYLKIPDINLLSAHWVPRIQISPPGPSFCSLLTFVPLAMARRLCEAPALYLQSSQLSTVSTTLCQLSTGRGNSWLNWICFAWSCAHSWASYNQRCNDILPRPSSHVHFLSPSQTTWENKGGMVHQRKFRKLLAGEGTSKTTNIQHSVGFINSLAWQERESRSFFKEKTQNERLLQLSGTH